MQIKTKRGPRRIRNQRVRDHRYVVTDYTGCSYVTAGKLYRVECRNDPDSFIISDDGYTMMVPTTFDSAYFDFKDKWSHPIR